jgi:hypothetical protein
VTKIPDNKENELDPNAQLEKPPLANLHTKSVLRQEVKVG